MKQNKTELAQIGAAYMTFADNDQPLDMLEIALAYSQLDLLDLTPERLRYDFFEFVVRHWARRNTSHAEDLAYVSVLDRLRGEYGYCVRCGNFCAIWETHYVNGFIYSDVGSHLCWQCDDQVHRLIVAAHTLVDSCYS